MSIELEEINWFSKIHSLDSWFEWNGPEDEQVAKLNDDLLGLYEALVRDKESEKIWDSKIKCLVKYLRNYTPYDENEDAYFGPNHAVWQAAWVYHLNELYKAKDIYVPPQLSAPLHWFTQGHWPCSYNGKVAGDKEEHYIVL